MSWFTKNSKFFRIAGGIAISASGLAWAVSSNIRKNANDVDDKQDFLYSSYNLRLKPSTIWDKNWDRREPANLIKPPKKKANNPADVTEENLQKHTAKANRHLLLVRHGQYFIKEPEEDKKTLTELGRQQADYTGQRLLTLNLPYTHIIHSSMIRAKETAEIIHNRFPDLKMQQCDLLCEGAPFPPEPASANWKPEHRFLTDGVRIEAAFRKYFHRAPPQQETDSYEVIVCHANVIRYFVCRALQLPPEAWLRMTLNHGSVTWITIRPSGNVILRSLGDTGYMPPDKLSHL